MNSDDPHNKSITKSIKKIETIMSSLKYARCFHELPDAPTKPIPKTKKIGAGKHNKMRNTKKWKKHNKMRNTKRPKNLS